MHRPRHAVSSNPSGGKAQLVIAYQELANELHSNQLKVIGNYTLGRIIGEGSFGTVRLGIHRLTGSRVAVKHIPKSCSPPLLTREIHHHRRLHHPNVVQLYEVIASEHSIWLITELCAGGELFDYLVEKTRFTESEARRLFGQICLGLGYVHGHGVVHRDLKLENVLLDERCNPKLADFGFGREFEPRKLLDTFCGTTGYAAPEMLAGNKYLGPEADIWSLGIILHALLTGSLPFDDDDEDTMKAMILVGHFEIPPFVSNEACNLIQSILQHDPKARPSIERILSHPWFTTPPLQHSFADLEPLSRPSPILEEVQPSLKSSPTSVLTLSHPQSSQQAIPLTRSHSTSDVQQNPSHHPLLNSDGSQSSVRDNNLSLSSSGHSRSRLPVTSEHGQVAMSTTSDPNRSSLNLPSSQSTSIHAATGLSHTLIAKHSNPSNLTFHHSQPPPSTPSQVTPSHLEAKSKTASLQSTPVATESSLTSQRDPNPSNQPLNVPHFKAKAGSLKPLPLTAMANLPSNFSHPQIRTPSRTKRRSVGSTLSERMGPFDEGTPSDLMTPTHNQSRLSVSSLLTVVIDYVGALKATTQAPILSKEDLLFLKSLGSLGFDSGQIIHSVQSYACDSSGALWWLLKKKMDQQLIHRDDILSPFPSTNHPLNHQDPPSRQPHMASNLVSSPSDSPSGAPVSVSYRKASSEDIRNESPLTTRKLNTNSANVPIKAPSHVQPIFSISNPLDTNSSSLKPDQIEKLLNAQHPLIVQDPSHLNSKHDSCHTSSTLNATPIHLADDARSAISSFKIDLVSGSDQDTPHIVVDPTSLSVKTNSDLRKRSQSVSMLQRATHALATKKSAEEKHVNKSRSREASTAHDADEKYGNEKVSKKDLKARERESKLEEHSKFSNSLPLSSLFSRKASLLHPLPHLPPSMISHQTPPGSDKSMNKNAQKLKENDVSVIVNNSSSSTPSTPSKKSNSRITSRESSDADLNLIGEDQIQSTALSIPGSFSPSNAPSQNLPFNHLDALCTPKPHSSSTRTIIAPPNSKTEEHKSVMESSPAFSLLSEAASSQKPSPSESEINQGHRHKSAKGSLFSNFRLWFNEDRRKRKQNVGIATNYSRETTSPNGAMVNSPVLTSPSTTPNVGHDLQGRKILNESQANRSASGTVAAHRRHSRGSRRSSVHSNRQAPLEPRNHSASKYRSDSNRASFGSITDTRTPASEQNSYISGAQSTIHPSRGSSDGNGRNRRPEAHGRRTSISSAGSRRSIAPAQHLTLNQIPIINPTFVRRTSSTGTTVRRVTAPVSSSTSNSSRPRPPKPPSFTSSIRTSMSSDEGIPSMSRRTSGGPEDHRLHSPMAVVDVDEIIEEEDDGGEEEEEEEKEKGGKESIETLRKDDDSRLKADDARRNAFQKLSGDKTVKTHSQPSLEGGSMNQSNITGTATRTIFMAHKPHSVFGTPTQAFFNRSTQSPIAAKFNTSSSISNGTSYSILMKSIADGPSSRKSTTEPKFRDVFANKSKEEGEWVDLDDEDDVCSRYEGGIGQGVQSRNQTSGSRGVDKNSNRVNSASGQSTGGVTSLGKLESSSSIKKKSNAQSSSIGSSSSSSNKPSMGFKPHSDSINHSIPPPGNSPAASLIGNWRGGHPRVTSNFKSIAIEEEEEED